jgi:hypothetical protein
LFRFLIIISGEEIISLSKGKLCIANCSPPPFESYPIKTLVPPTNTGLILVTFTWPQTEDRHFIVVFQSWCSCLQGGTKLDLVTWGCAMASWYLWVCEVSTLMSGYHQCLWEAWAVSSLVIAHLNSF